MRSKALPKKYGTVLDGAADKTIQHEPVNHKNNISPNSKPSRQYVNHKYAYMFRCIGGEESFTQYSYVGTCTEQAPMQNPAADRITCKTNKKTYYK